jgi:DNA helicase-2/ATP-dependent DNA helicase PcrA
MNARVRLSATQKLVVEHDEGALLVLAGPGSGKTRVLTERVARLLREDKSHFRVLALTFTNKAANEMRERLKDIKDISRRAFIGTLHSFCSEVLSDRGKAVGISGLPHIFQSYQDRKQVLLDAIYLDPVLTHELTIAGDKKQQNERVDGWMKMITWVKSHPLTVPDIEDSTDQAIYQAYNAGLRVNGAVDFDDLLSLTFKLFRERPKVADFYRRLYKYICIDEAQDLNEVQYAVLTSLCGDHYRNVMMVGDPAQSIYGFNTSDPKFMSEFQVDFDATVIRLSENFRSSKAVVAAARALDPSYTVAGQLPIEGEIELFAGKDEAEEAALVLGRLKQLLKRGHPDVEGEITYNSCAVLARTRYTLLAVETAFREKNIPFYKQLSASYECETDLLKDFELALRIILHPADKLHLNMLLKRWDASMPDLSDEHDGFHLLKLACKSSENQRAQVITNAVSEIATQRRFDLMPSFDCLSDYANTLADRYERQAILEDVLVLREEWDWYLRSDSGTQRSLASFLASVALGTNQQPRKDGIALLTVHSSKGLEFDVVFIVGLAEGVFPDYRSRGNAKALDEEKRNAFVAVTRSRRLLYMGFPKTRKMPWGEVWFAKPSPYLLAIQTVANTR